jgi:hypothetical protein
LLPTTQGRMRGNPIHGKRNAPGAHIAGKRVGLLRRDPGIKRPRSGAARNTAVGERLYIYWSDDPGSRTLSSRRSFEGKLC